MAELAGGVDGAIAHQPGPVGAAGSSHLHGRPHSLLYTWSAPIVPTLRQPRMCEARHHSVSVSSGVGVLAPKCSAYGDNRRVPGSCKVTRRVPTPRAPGWRLHPARAHRRLGGSDAARRHSARAAESDGRGDGGGYGGTAARRVGTRGGRRRRRRPRGSAAVVDAAEECDDCRVRNTAG